MKGQIFEVAAIGLIVTVATFVIIIVPFIFTRIHFVETIDSEVVQNNAQLTLLALLSSTYQNKPVYQILVEHEAFKQYPNIQAIITPKMDQISQCYNLQLGNEVIAKSKGCDPQKFTAQARLVLPYQPDKKVVFLNLTID